MEELLDDDEEKYKSIFQNYIEEEIESEDVEEITLTLMKPLELTHLSNQLKRNSPKNNTRLNLRNTDNKIDQS